MKPQNTQSPRSVKRIAFLLSEHLRREALQPWLAFAHETRLLLGELVRFGLCRLVVVLLALYQAGQLWCWLCDR